MLLIVLSSLALVSCICGENPAIQLALSDKGLQTVRHFAAGVIQDKLDQIELPEVRGNVMGVHYTLSGMKVASCDFPEPSVRFCPEVSGLILTLSGLNVAMTGNWDTHFGIIGDSGTFSLAVFDLTMYTRLGLGSDSAGRPFVSIIDCQANVQSVDMQFSGGSSWTFQWLVDFFQDHIRSRIENEVCPGVTKAIQRLDEHLQAIDVSVDVTPVMNLDLPLTAPPAVDIDSINFGLRGEFYSPESHTDPPFVAPPFSLPIQTDYMLTGGVSDYTANSASFAYYISGHLQTLVNDSMIPPFSPVRLNTTSIGRFIPQLPKLFPDCLMVLQVYARQTPFFSFELGFVKLDLLSAIKAFVVEANSTLTPIFKLHADAALSGKIWLDSEKVKSVLKMDNFSLSLASSEIGAFKTAPLQAMAKVGVSQALDRVNKKLAEGFELPQIKNVHLVNTVLSMEKGFIAFASDAELQSTF